MRRLRPKRTESLQAVRSYFHSIDADDPADRQRQVDEVRAAAASAVRCEVFLYPTLTAIYVTFDSDIHATAYVLTAPKALVCSSS